MRPIQLHDVSVHFDDHLVFDHLNATIATGQRIALIGANGAGKSTLLRAVAGRMTPNQGLVALLGARVRWLDAPANNGGSWGEREWQALAEVVRSDADLICLDEPTRHLDRQHRLQLANLVERSRLPAFLIISHDLDFLDRVANVTWELKDAALTVFGGPPRAYLQQREAAASAYQRQYAQQALRIEALRQDVAETREQARHTERRTHVDTTRRYAKKVAKKAKSRERRLEQFIASDEYLPPPRDPHVLRFTWDHVSMARGVIARIESGRVGYDDRDLLHDLFLEVKSGDRIGVVGNNGSGKSTLIEALLGANPDIRTTGYWRRFEAGSVGSMSQALDHPPDTTVWEYFAAHSSLGEGLGRAWLNAYGLSERQRTAEVSSLSHGERVKLDIASLAAAGPSTLVLDEPEHHLDWPSLTAIARGLYEYPGTLFVISHIPSFLRDVGCQTLWQVEAGKVFASRLT